MSTVVRRSISSFVILAVISACHPPVTRIDSAVFPLQESESSAISAGETYSRVSEEAAVLLGCDLPANSPICDVASPSAEEDAAFAAEASRLMRHAKEECRELGIAIDANRPSVRMYRKALVRYSGGSRIYGLGHTYSIDDVWLVRVARRIDDLNERSIEEKTRTLRHEMSHTIGASEVAVARWTAEDYATRCE